MLRLGSWLLKQSILFFRPMLGCMGGRGKPSFCVYPTSCTDYALDVLEQKPFLIAVYLIIKRLLFCNPLGAWFLYR